MWEVGAARRPLEGDFTGIELLGWGQPDGRIRRVEEPLQLRAVVLRHSDATLVYACAEICFVTQSLRDGVRRALAEKGVVLEERELVLAATHTHSGPAGYAHSLLYNLSNCGYVPAVYQAIVDGLCLCVLEAWRNRTPGKVWLNRGPIPYDAPVAFNRDLEAHGLHADAPPFDPNLPETATNREVTVLRVDDQDGPRAAICWFAVHNTNVHFDNHAVHGDNKGYAARFLEEFAAQRLDRNGFVGIFAQGASGDVTPNFRPNAQRGLTLGAYDDDFESARFNGRIQFEFARDLLVGRGEPLEGLSTVCKYVDFAEQAVDPQFAQGQTGRRTGPARYGVGIMEGTAEGPGPLWRAKAVRRALTRTVALAKRSLRRVPGWRRRFADGVDDAHGPMFTFLEAGRGAHGRALKVVPMLASGIPRRVDPVVREVKRLRARGADLHAPWTPSVVPVHLARIGDFVLASFPCEPTTMAGWRLESLLREALDVEAVQVAGYSNAYHGYLTTWEQYQGQAYEAAHTVFGQWSLGAYQTVVRELAAYLDRPQAEHPTGPKPLRYSAEELQRRAYEAPPVSRSWG